MPLRLPRRTALAIAVATSVCLMGLAAAVGNDDKCEPTYETGVPEQAGGNKCDTDPTDPPEPAPCEYDAYCYPPCYPCYYDLCAYPMAEAGTVDTHGSADGSGADSGSTSEAYRYCPCYVIDYTSETTSENATDPHPDGVESSASYPYYYPCNPCYYYPYYPCYPCYPGDSTDASGNMTTDANGSTDSYAHDYPCYPCAYSAETAQATGSEFEPAESDMAVIICPAETESSTPSGEAAAA